MIKLMESPSDSTWQFLGLSQSRLTGIRVRLASRSLMSSWHDYYSQFQIVFKENSGLRLDVESTRLAFNSMFINRLNWDLSLLAKRTRM